MADPHLSTAPGTTTGDKPAVDLQRGALVGQRYRLVEQLGEGAMGEVWRAEHEELHIDVAVKFVGADALSEVYQERFRFEAQVAAQISRRSPYVVAVNDAGTHHGRPYLVMDLVEGASVFDVVYDNGPLEVRQVLRLLEQVGSAIDVAHEAGIFHRDVKPANILVERDGDGLRFMLADFGVAKMHAEVLALDRPQTTQRGQLVGTPAYMSPSQFTGGEVDGSIDRWALAVVAYEALTATLPFDGNTTSAIFAAVVQRNYVPVGERRPGLPAGLEAWFRQAWAADERGFPTCRAMAEAFAAAIEESSAQGTARAWPPSDADPEATLIDEPAAVPLARPAWVPMLVVAALLSLGIGAWVVSSSGDPVTTPPETEATPAEPPAASQAPAAKPQPDVAEAPTPASTPSAAPEPSMPKRSTPEPSTPHPSDPRPSTLPPSTPKAPPPPSPTPTPKVVPKNEIL